MNDILKLEEIPPGIMEELKTHYDNIWFDNYGNTELLPTSVSRKLKFTQLMDENVDATVIDPLTFEQQIYTGMDTYQSYMFRGVEESNSDTNWVHVYSIQTTGIVLEKHVK